MKKFFILLFSILLLSSCSTQEVSKKNDKVEKLSTMFSEYRASIEQFNDEKAEGLYVDISEMLSDDQFDKDRVVLEGYLQALYKSGDEGVKPYQQFLKALPENYDGILSEVLWEDYRKLLK